MFTTRTAHHDMDSRLPPWEQNPAGPPPPSRLCPQGHLLAIIDGQPPSYNGGWMCDMCSAHLPPHTDSVLHCPICRFDVCSACQARAASAPPGAAFNPPPAMQQHLHFDLNELLGGGGAGLPIDLQGILGGGGQGGIGDAINNLLQQLGPFIGGPSGAPPAVQNVIDGLPRVTITDIEDDPTCFVCQDQFLQFEAALQLPCSHLFHQDCISQWLARHATCPTCRASVQNVDSSAAAIASAAAPASRHFRPIHESRLPLLCEFTKLHGPQWCDVSSSPDSNVKFLLPPCGCTLHLKCMRQWASMSGSSQLRRCPSCRTEFIRPIQLDMDQSDPEATPKRSNVTAQTFSSAIDELLASVGQGGESSALDKGQDHGASEEK